MGFFSKYDHIAGSFAHGLGQGWQMGLQGMQMREARRHRDEERKRYEAQQARQEEQQAMAFLQGGDVESGREVLSRITDPDQQAEAMERFDALATSMEARRREDTATKGEGLVQSPMPTSLPEIQRHRQTLGEYITSVPPVQEGEVIEVGTPRAAELSARQAATQRYDATRAIEAQKEKINPWNPSWSSDIDIFGHSLRERGMSPEAVKLTTDKLRTNIRASRRTLFSEMINQTDSPEVLQRLSVELGIDDPFLVTLLEARYKTLAGTEEEKENARHLDMHRVHTQLGDARAHQGDLEGAQHDYDIAHRHLVAFDPSFAETAPRRAETPEQKTGRELQLDLLVMKHTNRDQYMENFYFTMRAEGFGRDWPNLAEFLQRYRAGTFVLTPELEATYQNIIRRDAGIIGEQEERLLQAQVAVRHGLSRLTNARSYEETQEVITGFTEAIHNESNEAARNYLIAALESNPQVEIDLETGEVRYIGPLQKTGPWSAIGMAMEISPFIPTPVLEAYKRAKALRGVLPPSGDWPGEGFQKAPGMPVQGLPSHRRVY